MSKNASLDTNVLLRWLVGDVPKQQKQVEALLSRDMKYHVVDMAIAEVVFVMEYYMKFPRDLVAGFLTAIIEQPKIECNRSLLYSVIPYYEKHTTESFVDCCLAVYAKLDGTTPVYTFDKKMARDLPYVELLK